MAFILNFRVILQLNSRAAASRSILKRAFGLYDLMNSISTLIREIDIPDLHLPGI
jgi:hypothetical protein